MMPRASSSKRREAFLNEKSNKCRMIRAYTSRCAKPISRRRRASMKTEKSLVPLAFPKTKECSTLTDSCEFDREIIEHLSTMSDDNRRTCRDVGIMACSEVSNSMGIQMDSSNDCAFCLDCVECTMQRKASREKLNGTINENSVQYATYPDDLHSDEHMTIIDEVSPATSVDEKPILVDLTDEETKATLKQTILRHFCDAGDLIEMSGQCEWSTESHKLLNEVEEARIMIADSSSRLHRGNTGSSLATALRDRGPCIIPVQPNRSLPIRPAPPAPTRALSIVKCRKDSSPTLKLSKSSTLDVELLEPTHPKILVEEAIAKDESEFDLNENNKLDGEIFPRVADNPLTCLLPQISSLVHLAVTKRNYSELDSDLDVSTETKKRKKSHNADSVLIPEERIDSILKEFVNSSPDTLVDEAEKTFPTSIGDQWSEKGCPGSLGTSSISSGGLKEKDASNKVPPLRLKKVVREDASLTNDGNRKIESFTAGEKQSKYRIVTGTTPRADSSWYNLDKRDSCLEIVDNSQHRDPGTKRSTRSDGYKLKYRRNRLRQKLRKLRGKAIDLARQMVDGPDSNDSSPQRSTRLRQMMNCYEKQIENLSKLLNKLSATPAATDDVVDCDADDTDDRCTGIVFNTDDDLENEISVGSPSSSSSAEPPKLSPRSSDYDQEKSPEDVRNSPPVLPRVCLTIPPNLNILDGQEVSVAASGSTWAIPQKSSASISMPQDVSNVEATPPIAQISNAPFTDRRRATPPNPSLTSNEQSAVNTVVKLDPPKASPSKPKEASSSSRPAKLQQSAENNLFGRGSMKEQSKSGDGVSEISQGYTRDVAANETARLPDAKERAELVPINGPVVTSLCNPVEVTSAVRYGDIYGSLPSMGTRPRVSTAAVTNILQLQSNYYGSVLPTGATEDPRHVQKVTSTSNHSANLDCPQSARSYNQIGSSVPPPSHQCGTLSKINNDEVVKSDSTRKSDGTRIMAEQFPTLGNWVARMSKKYVSKPKTKVQGATAIPAATAEETKRAPVPEVQKGPIGSGSNVPRNVMNIAPQWNTERWQRHQRQQQRQQQQLLQQVATVAAPAQPLSGAASSRPGMCPPISMSQFYPNNYGIDPYAGAFGYHPAVYPYSSYPYHPRLHPGPPISAYQIPMQDTLTSSLRPMQHVDKRLPSIQDPTRQFTTDLLKYSGSLSSTGFQHPNAVDFERLRTAAATHTTGTTGCLPQLLLPSAPMQSSSQATTLSRASPSSYSSSTSQFGRRMLPDMVAAAAAAAVVAAASFGRQRDPFARPAAEAATGVAGIISGETGQLGSAGRGVNLNREHVPSVQQPTNIVNSSDEIRLNNNSYHQLQSLLLDGLPFVRTDGNIGQQASTFSSNMQNANTPAVPSSSYKISSLGSSRVPPLKDIARACETPHLGKVNRNPDNAGSLMCSNCGLAGSMFKCLGCEAAFYCDENCQARHWTVHVERCPKKMPKLKKVT